MANASGCLGLPVWSHRPIPKYRLSMANGLRMASVSGDGSRRHTQNAGLMHTTSVTMVQKTLPCGRRWPLAHVRWYGTPSACRERCTPR